MKLFRCQLGVFLHLTGVVKSERRSGINSAHRVNVRCEMCVRIPLTAHLIVFSFIVVVIVFLILSGDCLKVDESLSTRRGFSKVKK